jgi:hypothetical protein
MLLPRRRFLAAGLGAVGCGFVGVAGAASKIAMPAGDADRRFTVFYDGDKIGAHTVLYSAGTGETRIDTDIALVVKVAFFTAFKFTHRSSETWRDGRLASLRSVTVEHGDTLRVEGRATPQGFRVESEGGPFIASAATLTSNSLWTPAVLDQETVVDAQHGGVIGISARKLPEEIILLTGRQTPATRYTFITPYLAGSMWYDRNNLWVRGEFELDGSKIQYELDP